MDISKVLTQAFGTLFAAYWWMIPELLILGFLGTPFMKGVLGEFQVNKVIDLSHDSLAR